jgi:hypothetical protein
MDPVAERCNHGINVRVSMKTIAGISLTTRWSGPGMLRHRQETFKARAEEQECQGAIPGRSLA